MYNLNEEIGKRIVTLRHSRHMTQEKLAEELDISIKHCSGVERGVASLSLERLIDVCELFDVSLDYLVRGKTDDIQNTLPPSFIEFYQGANHKEKEVLHEYATLYLKIRSLPQND